MMLSLIQQNSLRRRILRRASSLLQLKIDAAAEAALAYAATKDAEGDVYKTPEEKFMTMEMTGRIF